MNCFLAAFDHLKTIRPVAIHPAYIKCSRSLSLTKLNLSLDGILDIAVNLNRIFNKCKSLKHVQVSSMHGLSEYGILSLSVVSLAVEHLSYDSETLKVFPKLRALCVFRSCYSIISKLTIKSKLTIAQFKLASLSNDLRNQIQCLQVPISLQQLEDDGVKDRPNIIYDVMENFKNLRELIILDDSPLDFKLLDQIHDELFKYLTSFYVPQWDALAKKPTLLVRVYFTRWPKSHSTRGKKFNEIIKRAYDRVVEETRVTAPAGQFMLAEWWPSAHWGKSVVASRV